MRIFGGGVTLLAFLAFGTVELGPSLAFAQASEQSRNFVLISDVDDTIKVSHISDSLNKVIRFFKTPRAFAGMATLYRASLAAANERKETPHFAVISGTPSAIEITLGAIEEFIEAFQFPTPQLLQTRPMLADTRDYKTREVRAILHHGDMERGVVVMVGDDTEFDPEAYVDAANSARSQGITGAIYIRRVTGRVISTRPQLVQTFDSAADIAAHEFVQGRLSHAAVLRVFDSILRERDVDNLFVPEEYCPTAKSPRASNDPALKMLPFDLRAKLVTVEDHTHSLCKRRNRFNMVSKGELLNETKPSEF